MAVHINKESVKQYHSWNAAERAILCFLLPAGPHGHCYEIVEHRYAQCGSFYGVKAYDKTGAFVGYCYDPESEQ